MTRTPIWKSIATALTSEIGIGQYSAGDRLPSEAELARRFDVNRHTVRRALADMAEQGLVHSRRGAGVFVASKPTDYPIGRRVRFSQNLGAAGHATSRRVLTIETRRANPREAENLQLDPDAAVIVNENLSFIDNVPVSLSRHVFPADRFPGLAEAIRETKSITRALKSQGVNDYTRAQTRLTAKRANATQALHLRIREGDPILRTISVNVDARKRPVEYGHTWFVGDRISLTVVPD